MNGASNGKSVSSGNKKRGRFNIIDLILIIISLVLVAVLVYVFSPISLIRNITQKQEKTINYIVEFTNIDKAFEKSITEGENVIDAITKSNIGKVSSIETSSYVEYDWKSETETVEDETITSYKPVVIDYPDRCNIVVTITVTADYTENKGYSVDSTRIAVGEKMALRFPGFVGEGHCIGIN